MYQLLDDHHQYQTTPPHQRIPPIQLLLILLHNLHRYKNNNNNKQRQYQQNDSIRSPFATTGGIDESLDPNNPKGEDNVDGERPDYAFLASLFSVTEPTPGQLVQAAETNTDIDVEKIRESARESLGDLIYLRTFLAMGDIEAARFFTSKIDRQMLDVGMEVGFTRPVEQMILVEGSIDDEAATAEEGEGSNVSNSGQLIAEPRTARTASH